MFTCHHTLYAKARGSKDMVERDPKLLHTKRRPIQLEALAFLFPLEHTLQATGSHLQATGSHLQATGSHLQATASGNRFYKHRRHSRDLTTEIYMAVQCSAYNVLHLSRVCGTMRRRAEEPRLSKRLSHEGRGSLNGIHSIAVQQVDQHRCSSR